MLHLAKFDVPRYLGIKRERKKFKKQRKIDLKHRLEIQRKKTFEENFGSSSKIIDLMAHGHSAIPGDRKRKTKFILPANFSIAEDAGSVFSGLNELSRRLKAHKLKEIFLDFSKLKKQDLSSNGILAVLVEELVVSAKKTGHKLRWKGTFPSNESDQRFLRAMGVIKHLKIEHEYVQNDEEKLIKVFDVRCKHYMRTATARQADKKTKTTENFAKHIDKCLEYSGRQLTRKSRSVLCQYVSEIIDNAEQHGHMKDWSIQGYLDLNMSQPMCEIAIFNFGTTIAQSLDELPHDSYTKRQIQQYIDLHEKGGLFKQDWRKEDLYTLIALQGNVSSKNKSEEDTRGNGTVDLINFFQQVQRECSPDEQNLHASMAIASGSTVIVFDGTYLMKPNAEGVNIIAFNSDNDLMKRPDPTYVRTLDGAYFPGTVISLKFPLSAAAMKPAATGGSHEECRAND